MINLTELRIGNIVSNSESKMPIIVNGISEEFIITKNEFGEYENVLKEKVEPLILDNVFFEKLLNHRILQKIKNDNIFYFADSRTTYFLVYKEEEDNYFIGMIDTELPEKYRRITSPFVELHKLQNAYFVIYNKELKGIRL